MSLMKLFGLKGTSKKHIWSNGFRSENFYIPDDLNRQSLRQLDPADLSAPVLFLARGHSGTRAMAEILHKSGVYIGNFEDKNSLNVSYDSLYWAYGFQRTLIPKLFRYGQGCLIDPIVTIKVGIECLQRHLFDYSGGPWGFKTCAGMFCHPLYQYLFPRAKYIYMVRDGRDVILSGGGRFHLTQSVPAHPFWNYFKIITFGVSNDVNSCPFPFPQNSNELAPMHNNKYWVQAKSWCEHVRMVEKLKNNSELSSQVKLIRYEDLCSDPVYFLEELFQFLDIELTEKVKQFSQTTLHSKSVGRWKNYKRYITDCEEDMEAIFASMSLELSLLGYEI